MVQLVVLLFGKIKDFVEFSWLITNDFGNFRRRSDLSRKKQIEKLFLHDVDVAFQKEKQLVEQSGKEFLYKISVAKQK